MKSRRRAVLEILLAVAAAAGCVASWLASQSPVEVAPIADGQPATTSISFYAPMIIVAFMLGTLAGVLAVIGVSRWRRS